MSSPTKTELNFSEFPPTSYEAWRKEAEVTLKGAPFEKKLISKTYEGIDLQPIYLRADGDKIEHAKSLPGYAPYVRGSKVLGQHLGGWEISQEFTFSTPKEFNSAVRTDLERGLTAINLVLDQATRNGIDPDSAKAGEVGKGGLSIATLNDLKRALEGIDLTRIPLFARTGASGLPFAALLFALTKNAGKQLSDLRGCIEMDPIGVVAHEGSLPQSFEEAYREMAILTGWAAEHAPKLQTVCVHSRSWHEGGANAVQELAFSIATGAEYLRQLTKAGLDVNVVAPRIRFSITVSTNFFLEIAKLRAARLLWAQVVKAFGGNEEAQKLSLHVRTSNRNKTVYDPYVNMLRTTVEAFAGVVGGADSMHVSPFDEVIRTPDDFSRRIARNTQIILQKECHLEHVVDAAGGSWYVETLTDKVARKAWELFQQVEGKGGIQKALEAGFPQDAIAEVAKSRDKAAQSAKDRILGTNVYPNAKEKLLEVHQPDLAAIYKRRSAELAEFRTSSDQKLSTSVLDKLSQLLDSAPNRVLDAAINAVSSGASLGEITRTIRSGDSAKPSIKPVKISRQAEPFEQLRSSVEALPKRPAIQLIPFGPLKQFKARADFSAGFFRVAGFEIIYPKKGFATPDEAVKGALESPSKVSVICSTDDTYPELVPAFVKGLKAADPKRIVILAGYPTEHVEAFKQAGVDEFIHVRANIYQVLSELLKKVQ
jgi:methylmalonyl-CoA mutase